MWPLYVWAQEGQVSHEACFIVPSSELRAPSSIQDPSPALFAAKYVSQTKFPGCQAFRML